MTIVFGVSVIIFLYTAGYSWYVGGAAISESVPWLYSTMAISGASLFALSSLYYARRLDRIAVLQRTLLSLFDLGTYFCIVALVVWGLIFPILRPITDPTFQLYLLDQRSLAMGLYTGLVLCSVVIVFRVALQLLFARSNGIIVATQASNAIVGNPIPLRDIASNDDSSLEQNLSSIRFELSRLREEIASMSTPNPALRLTSLVGAVEEPPSNRKSKIEAINHMEAMPSTLTKSFTQNLPASVSTPKENGSEDIPYGSDLPDDSISSEPFTPTPGGPQVPDAALDNPWASILSRRLPPKRIVVSDNSREIRTQLQPPPEAQREKTLSPPPQETQITEAAPPQESQMDNVSTQPPQEPQVVDVPLQLQETRILEIPNPDVQAVQISQASEEKRTESLSIQPSREKKPVRKSRKRTRKEKPESNSTSVPVDVEKSQNISTNPISDEKVQTGIP